MDEDKIDRFVQNLLRLMKQRGIDNAQLSKMTGIPLPSIDRILGNISSPNQTAMEKISEAVGVALDNLIGETSIRENDGETTKDFQVSKVEKEILVEYRKLPDNHWLKQAIAEVLLGKSTET